MRQWVASLLLTVTVNDARQPDGPWKSSKDNPAIRKSLSLVVRLKNCRNGYASEVKFRGDPKSALWTFVRGSAIQRGPMRRFIVAR
jgi:hypothetical protein